MSYPPTECRPFVETLHGEPVADPYRWLEAFESDEVRTWAEEQNRFARDYLDGLAGRQPIRRRLEELMGYTRLGVPVSRGETAFFLQQSGMSPQGVLACREGLDGPTRVLVDPHDLDGDGRTALTGFAPDPAGRRVAYGLSDGGSDWQRWHVLDVESGRTLADRIDWIKFSEAVWNADGSGFWYGRYAAPGEKPLAETNRRQQLCFHRLGTPQSEDRIVFAPEEHPDWGFVPRLSDDGRFLLITVWKGSDKQTAVWIRPADESDAPPRPLRPAFDAVWTFLGGSAEGLVFHTDLDAPLGRIVRIDGDGTVETLVGESDATLVGGGLVGGRLLLGYLRDACSEVAVHDPAGRPLGRLDLPGRGTVVGLKGRSDDRYTYFAYTDFATPTSIVRFEPATGRSEPFHRPDLDLPRIVTEQRFVVAADGTRIPLFVNRLAGAAKDRPARTYLYGYGGFNVSVTPAFSAAHAVWCERDGVHAVANVRGGGEYGDAWHRAAQRKTKERSFDDFIACAESLVASGVTSSSRLAIGGHSNGGLLVAACMVRRPELFGAVVPGVGVLDMLRFHRFTIGWAWIAEYGSPDEADSFPVLKRYSPLHNLRRGTRYPATLILTGDHDDRVVPAHSYKFAAALQAAQGGDAPVLLRVAMRTGHGAGKPTDAWVDEIADSWSFLEDVLEPT